MKKILIIILVSILISGFLFFDLGQYLNLEYLKSQKQAIAEFYTQRPLMTMSIYFISYVVMAAISLPGAVILTLAGGAIFGLIKGTLLVSFASSLGATLAFLISRSLLQQTIQNKFGDSLKSFNEGIKKEGAFYLFTLRLVPLFPFFVVNLVMGLTPIKTTVFYWVSQVGMLAGTIVFVNAGTQLAQINSLSGILSPALISSFVLLGLFPLMAKKVLAYLKRRRAS